MIRPCLGFNGRSAFKHNQTFSFQVATVDQDETDRYWNRIVGNMAARRVPAAGARTSRGCRNSDGDNNLQWKRLPLSWEP
ncbi:VOC family protein [Leptothermofonsia sichuanensis]|uniref:VOC family protein n=1 Tax=Leptothermofonsia sichuanensis TaxID=2917832 RepID=UPI0036F3F970